MTPIAATDLPAIYFPETADDVSLGQSASWIDFQPRVGSSLFFEPLTVRSELLLSALAASGAASVEALTEAARFLELLPLDIPDPDIVVEEDGQIGLDWRVADKSLSLNLGRRGMIGYSALFDCESSYGRVPFTDTEISPRISPFLRLLARER
jgi:hypothetical protein